MPATTGLPEYSRTRGYSFSASSGTGIRCSPSSSAMAPFSAATLSTRRFIGGVPMKPATKRFSGRSYSRCGASTCWSSPWFITATRSPIVIASTWSCVT